MPALMKPALSSIFVCSLLSACASSPPPAAEAPEASHEAAPKAAPAPAIKMQSELGQIDPAAVKKTFRALASKFEACQAKAAKRVEVVGGAAKFFLRVSSEGAAKWTYLEESDIGDREMERCLLEVVGATTWPKPDQGEAEVRYGMELPVQSARPATDWSQEKVASVLAKRGAAFDKCKAGSANPFSVTLYVGEGGKVLSAGGAVADRADSDKVDCIVGAARETKGLPSPGSWPAKVTIKL